MGQARPTLHAAGWVFMDQLPSHCWVSAFAMKQDAAAAELLDQSWLG